MAIFSGGAANALKATGVGAKIVAASSRIKNTVARFGDDIANVSQRMLNDMGDVVLPKQVVTPDGRVFTMKRNDLLDDGRPQNSMMKDGDKDGVGGNETPEEKRKRLQEKKRKIEDEKIKEKIEGIKKQSFQERKQELGNDPVKGYVEHEGEVGAKIEQKYGYLERAPNPDVEWISLSGKDKGKSLDLIGLEPGISDLVPNDMKRFTKSLEEHIGKADIVVLDYRYMNQTQIDNVENFLKLKGISEGASLKKIWTDNDL